MYLANVLVILSGHRRIATVDQGVCMRVVYNLYLLSPVSEICLWLASTWIKILWHGQGKLSARLFTTTGGKPVRTQSFYQLVVVMDISFNPIFVQRCFAEAISP